MGLQVDYYLSLNSPWTHLGAARIVALAARFNANLRVFPVDFGTIFAASGGLSLTKRSPQRQAYRMMELRRWRAETGVPLTLDPAFFPCPEATTAPAIIAVRETIGDAPALALAHAVLKAVWEAEANPADPATFARLIAGCGLDAPAVLALAADPAWAAMRAADSAAALERGVFGAPSYVIEGEIFWGQDRLSFVEKRLAAG